MEITTNAQSLRTITQRYDQGDLDDFNGPLGSVKKQEGKYIEEKNELVDFERIEVFDETLFIFG